MTRHTTTMRHPEQVKGSGAVPGPGGTPAAALPGNNGWPARPRNLFALAGGRGVSSLALAASLVVLMTMAGGCAKKGSAALDTAGKNPPPLPADVQKVAAAVQTQTAAQATSAASDPAGAPSQAVLASETSGSIVATGEFISPTRSELASKLVGRVGKIYADEGEYVHQGQPLLELEMDYPRLNLQRAEAEIARAKAAEDDARRDFERKKELIAKDSVPRATYDRSESTYEQARAAHAAAVASADMYRQQLADSVLRSPINGVVAERRTDVGQRLSEATVAFVIAQTAPLKLKFRVPEKFLTAVRRGQAVTATVDPYPGRKFTGKVTVVGGVIDSTTRSLVVETEFPNDDGKLRPGLFARVELQPST
jgi:membrane fusion protein, multidrug efflux system